MRLPIRALPKIEGVDVLRVIPAAARGGDRRRGGAGNGRLRRVHLFVHRTYESLHDWLREHRVTLQVETRDGAQSLDADTWREKGEQVLLGALSSVKRPVCERLMPFSVVRTFRTFLTWTIRSKESAFEKSCRDWRTYFLRNGVPEENICWLVNQPVR